VREARKIKQWRLARLVEAELGGERVSDQSISQWENGENEPPPYRVFAIERALGIPPGALSAHLKYQPDGSGPSILYAIDHDPEIPDEGRETIRALYLEALKQSSAAGDRHFRPTFETEKASRQRSGRSVAVAQSPRDGNHFSVADELTKLAALRDAGVLSEDEFQTQKKKLLSL
jgi:transcriptional regulator with XRE-family HTH domain